MGREAQCWCRWGQREGDVTALLESSGLIVRGGFRATAARTAIEQVRVRDDVLSLHAAGEAIELALGARVAAQWAKALTAAPPTLATKLGIAQGARVHVVGKLDEPALLDALAHAVSVELGEADVAILRTDDGGELAAMAMSLAQLDAAPPLWIVYRKGRGAPMGELVTREIMRTHGFIDTKVASVSESLTALRFIRRS